MGSGVGADEVSFPAGTAAVFGRGPAGQDRWRPRPGPGTGTEAQQRWTSSGRAAGGAECARTTRAWPGLHKVGRREVQRALPFPGAASGERLAPWGSVDEMAAIVSRHASRRQSCDEADKWPGIQHGAPAQPSRA